MQNLPPWLPSPLKLPDSHNLEATDLFLLEAQALFLQDFSEGNVPLFEGKPVKIDRRLHGDFNYRFWHIVTTDSEIDTSKRELKISRCCLIPWIKPLLTEGIAQNAIISLKPNGNNKRRRNLNWWIEEMGYRIILEDYGQYWNLISGFHITTQKDKFRYEIIRSYRKELLTLYPQSQNLTSIEIDKELVALLKSKGVCSAELYDLLTFSIHKAKALPINR